MAAKIKKSDTVLVIAGKDINKRGEVSSHHFLRLIL